MSFRGATTFLVPWEDGSVMVATGGLYAPTIRHHNGTAYILCTNVVHKSPERDDGEEGRNFIISTTDIWSNNWSDPVYYDFPGIDPSIFFDDDGRVYIQGSKYPDFEIYNFEADLASGKVLGEQKLIWTGWDKRFTESPHIYKKDGYYYLMCAEGGTFNFHMISMARSKTIWGPYEPCPLNPVLTAHGTSNRVQNTGHADLFQDKDGSWWAVMLGVRLWAGRFVMGRESFLSPVKWVDGEWPVVAPVTEHIDGPLPVTGDSGAVIEAADGIDWVYLRDPDLRNYQFSGSQVTIAASPLGLSTPMEPVSFIGKRQRSLDGEASVTIRPVWADPTHSVVAGIAVFKDEHRHVSISLDFATNHVRFEAVNDALKIKEYKKHELDRLDQILLGISYTELEYSFWFSNNGSGTKEKLGELDTLQMSGFDFTGPLIGIFALGQGLKVTFSDFEVD
jgi:beta-xylosidase